MREIKFRVWNPICREFNYYTPLSIHQYIKQWNNNLLNGRAIEQYTCLKDPDGKEIYEGDIVRTGELPHQKHLIVYNPPCFYLKGYNEGDYYVGGCVNFWDWDQFEVIGNIHENPELLT